MNELFQKEYFEIYDFYIESEKQFRKHPQINRITTGFCYRGGRKPVYTLISAFPSEKEALSSLDNSSTIEVLEELKENMMDMGLEESMYFIRMIDLKIKELKREDNIR